MNLKKTFQYSLLIPFMGLSLGVQAADKAADKQTAEQVQQMEKDIAAKKATDEASEKIKLAEQLTKYKNYGLIGERANGYVAPVRPNKKTIDIVRKVNQGRLDLYRKIAEANNFSVIQIEVMAGDKARERAKAGHYIESERLWVKKQ